ncbi:MAG TPA: creatininase family protein [Polyangia bacterium]|nr:creatininase family protein [Polyangia bacterium]
MRTLTLAIVLGTLAGPATAMAQKPPTRDMNDLNWMEFKKLVPARIDTVIVTVGTLEAHGVINDGADNTAPVAIAHAIADDVNALIAPHIPYGITGDLAPYPGGLHVPEDVFRNYMHAVLDGMVKNGFRRIVVLSGHGGPQTAVLQSLLREVAFEHGVQTLMVNWWTLCSDVTQEVFGEDGGHAGINETAFVQAINPKLVHKELYAGKEMATANPTPGAWAATPFPSSITLYKPGQGWPTNFDQKKADEYYKKVVAKVDALVKDTIKKWNAAGFR